MLPNQTYCRNLYLKEKGNQKMFKSGQTVRYLDEPHAAVVRDVVGGKALVLRDDGFEEWVALGHLVAVNPTLELDISISSREAKAKLQVSGSVEKKVQRKKGQVVEELDLHSGSLIGNKRNWQRHEILKFQLDAARRFIEENRGSGKRLILIHGVGEGVLRKELEVLLNGLEKVRYQDAEYALYGRGATEVFAS